MEKKYKIVLFDMDGTILDTLRDLSDSVNWALAECGLPQRTFAENRRFLGNGIINLIHRAVPEGTPEDLELQVRTVYKHHYEQHCNDTTKPFDGIPEAMEELRRRGYKLACVSNKPDDDVARLAEQKGLPVLLDAARAWARRTPSPLVVVAGEGPLRESLTARITAENLPVRLLGNRDDVADLLAAADVFVLSSMWEGQPLVVQEALRAGVPVVATDAGGVADLVGDAAVLVPVGDADALADGVVQVLDDEARAARMRLRSRAAAAVLPPPGSDCAQVISYYAELVDRARTR